MIVFFASGGLIIGAFYRPLSDMIQYSTEILNVLPDLISAAFLIDALRRLKNLAKETMHLETWQLTLHVWSFASVILAGVLLSVSTLHSWEHPSWFYATYEGIILTVFICELPFIYIINKIVS